MDKEVAEELAQMGGGLTVLTRSGSPKELSNIDRACAGTARRIIVLPPTDSSDDDDDAADGVSEATGLALALQRGLTKAQDKRASVVVNAPSGYTAEVATDQVDGFRSYAEVYPEDFISRILAQCSVQPGLSHVYAELLLQGAGHEIYTEPLARHRSMHGTSFGDASRRFGKAIPIGIVRAPVGGGDIGGDEQVLLSPADDELLQPTDSVVLIANSRGDTKPGRMRAKPRMPKPAADDEGATTAAKPLSEAPPKILFLNLDPSMNNMLAQIDEVAPKGSSITLFCPHEALPDNLPRMRRASLKHIEGDPTSPSELQDLGVQKYDAVICLQPGKGSESDDSKLLISLLALEQAARAEGAETPRVVGELHSPSMRELIDSRWSDNKWDFVLPNDLSAGILVQFALQPELKSIYTELLSPEGKELFFRPAYLYSSHSDKRGVTFEQLSVGARERGEVAVGVHLAGEQRPMINPPRDFRLKLNDGDKLVVIGDEF